MILKEGSFVVAERFGDVLALLFCQDDAVEALVEHVILRQVSTLFQGSPSLKRRPTL